MFEQIFKNIDDVLWKEAGCSSELDYTEQTSWMLFLKYLDDLEGSRAIEAELLQPIADVGEQELAHLRFTIVEAFRIPQRMIPARSGMEVLVAGAVEVTESLGRVLHRVGVDHIQQHRTT